MEFGRVTERGGRSGSPTTQSCNLEDIEQIVPRDSLVEEQGMLEDELLHGGLEER
jgi:hypothetical protein